MTNMASQIYEIRGCVEDAFWERFEGALDRKVLLPGNLGTTQGIYFDQKVVKHIISKKN